MLVLKGVYPYALAKMEMPAFLRAAPDGTFLAVRLQPRSSSNQIGPTIGDELRVKVTAPPVEFAANAALVELLGEILHCPRNRIELVRGRASRHKIVKVRGFSPEAVLAKLD